MPIIQKVKNKIIRILKIKTGVKILQLQIIPSKIPLQHQSQSQNNQNSHNKTTAITHTKIKSIMAPLSNKEIA